MRIAYLAIGLLAVILGTAALGYPQAVFAHDDNECDHDDCDDVGSGSSGSSIWRQWQQRQQHLEAVAAAAAASGGSGAAAAFVVIISTNNKWLRSMVSTLVVAVIIQWNKSIV